jgi:hypothetical protein
LDEYLEKLIRELGEAINRAIEESEDINQAIERIRQTGNDVFLVLEATVAFKEQETEKKEQAPAYKEISIEQRLAEISPEDRQFLKRLNIKFDNDD